MGTKIVIPPSTYPVTLEQAKQHVGALDFDDDDVLLNLYIRASTAHAENFTGRAFIDQTIDFYRDGFPANSGYIELPKPPLIELEGLFYSSDALTESEYASTSYLVDTASQKARLILWNGSTWPTITTSQNTVRIRYRAGYVADPEASPVVANVPDDIKAAILLMVGTLYAQRETVVVGQSIDMVPWAYENLLRQYRVHTAIG